MMSAYDLWKSTPPALEPPQCPTCHAVVTAGLSPAGGRLRHVWRSLDVEALFCDADCLQAWLEAHIADAVAAALPAVWDEDHVEVGV